MSSISLRLSDDLIAEVDTGAKQLHVSRTSYIRKALRLMNKTVYTQVRRERLMKVSRKVRENR